MLIRCDIVFQEIFTSYWMKVESFMTERYSYHPNLYICCICAWKIEYHKQMKTKIFPVTRKKFQQVNQNNVIGKKWTFSKMTKNKSQKTK